jgi:chemotaxis protein MotA
MDITSVIGIAASAGLLIFGMTAGGADIRSFHDAGAVAITFGGTFSALMIMFPMKVFAAFPKLALKAFAPFRPPDPGECAADIVGAAVTERKHGLLFLERQIDGYKDAFLRRSLQLIVDLKDPDEIREIMETELGSMIDRHASGIKFFEKGAVIAPGFGMLGTLAGLINILAGAESPDMIITAGMAGALITSFYALIISNMIFLPAANRLKKRSDDEVLCRQIIIEGIAAIANGETPKQIETKLMSYVPPGANKKIKMEKSIDSEDT